MRVLKLALAGYLSDNIRSLINVTSLIMILFSLQCFIFELIEFKAKVESSSHTECLHKLKIIKITKYTMLSILFAGSLAKIYIETVEPDPFKNKKDYFNDSQALRIVLITLMTFRILENLFMVFYAIYSIIYFLRIKIINLTLQNK
jgi:hypothetical protein